MLHRAALAAPSLPPPKNGSLRQAALASVHHLQAVSASPVDTPSTRKRSYSESDSPSALSPSNFPPLAQRIRSDLQIGEESPERELLRNQLTPLKFPSPSSPGVNGFPPPAPLAFTPSKLQVGFEGFETPVTQLLERSKDAELFEKSRDAEKRRQKEKLERLYRLRDRFRDLESRLEDGAISPEEFGIESEKVNAELKEEVGQKQEEKPKCLNCDGELSPDHQCSLIRDSAID